MRVINVITVKNGVVDEIESFGVIEEQLVNDVSEEAEKYFIKKSKEVYMPNKHSPIVTARKG